MAKRETIKTCRDVDCPKCGFPETLTVRDAKTMKPLWYECSSHSGCNYRQKARVMRAMI